MTKPKHTPGPWVVAGLDDFSRLSVETTEYCVALVDLSHAQDANARLIAAAPDLLEALEAAVECGLVPKSSVLDGGASRHARQVVVGDMIRAAIATAKGEE